MSIKPTRKNIIYKLLVDVPASVAPIISSACEGKGIIPISFLVADHEAPVADVEKAVEVVAKVSSVVVVVESSVPLEPQDNLTTVIGWVAAGDFEVFITGHDFSVFWGKSKEKSASSSASKLAKTVVEKRNRNDNKIFIGTPRVVKTNIHP